MVEIGARVTDTPELDYRVLYLTLRYKVLSSRYKNPLATSVI